MLAIMIIVSSCEKPDENEFPEVISPLAKLLSFNIKGEYIEPGDSLIFEADVDTANRIVSGIIPPIYNINKIIPEIMASRGATVNPESGMPQDFTNPPSYKITSRNGQVTEIYNVNMYMAGMVSFSIGGTELDIDYNDNTIIKVFNPDESPIDDIANVVPDIVITEGSSLQPAIGDTIDLRSPVIYSLITDRGDTINYFVSIKVDASFDDFSNFENDWERIGNITWDYSGTPLKLQNDWGWCNYNGAIKKDVDLQGDFMVELKARITNAEDVWPATGFFVGGNLDGTNPAYVFAIKGEFGATNLVGFHGRDGWIDAAIEVDGLNNREWTIMRMEKRGNEIKSYVNDVLVSTYTIEGVEGTLGLFGERVSAEFEYIKFQQL